MELNRYSNLNYPGQGIDFDADLELRAYTATALSATGSTDALNIPNLANSEKLTGVNIKHAAISGVDGSNYWTLTIEVDADGDFGSGAVAVWTQKLTGTATTYDPILSRSQIAAAVSTAKYLRVTATKTGTPGTLTYGAFAYPKC